MAFLISHPMARCSFVFHRRKEVKQRLNEWCNQMMTDYTFNHNILVLGNQWFPNRCMRKDSDVALLKLLKIKICDTSECAFTCVPLMIIPHDIQCNMRKQESVRLVLMKGTWETLDIYKIIHRNLTQTHMLSEHRHICRGLF